MTEVTRGFCWHQNFVPWGLYAPCSGSIYTCIKSWKKLYKIRFQKDFFWNLQQMGKVIRPFCWHQNFVPWELSAPAPGLYTCIKSWKKMYKIRLQRHFLKLATNKWSDKTFLLTSNFVPWGIFAPAPGLYTNIKSWKRLYKIRLQRDFFETCYKWPKWQDAPVDIKSLHRGYIHV